MSEGLLRYVLLIVSDVLYRSLYVTCFVFGDCVLVVSSVVGVNAFYNDRALPLHMSLQFDSLVPICVC